MLALRFMHSYHKTSMQRTKINSEYRSWEGVMFGVPQEAILGPLLFKVRLSPSKKVLFASQKAL